MESLGEARETLREMARYLMETALRAKNAGVNAPAFTIEGVIQMAADLMGCIVKIEAALGTGPPIAAKQPSRNGDSISDISKRFSEDLRKQAEEIQRKAMEDLREQFLESQKKTKPAEPVTP